MRHCKGCSHPTICDTHGCGAEEARHNKQKAAEAKAARVRLLGAACATSDWLAGGCDIHDIPRLEIALLAAFAREATQDNPRPCGD